MKIKFISISIYILILVHGIAVSERTNWKSPIPSGKSSTTTSSASKPSEPKASAPKSNSSTSVPDASSYAFAYNNSSSHTYDVYMPKRFKDSDATGLNKTAANPDLSAGTTKSTLRARFEYVSSLDAWVLKAESSLSMYGKNSIASNKSYPVLKGDSLTSNYAWPKSIQVLKGDDNVLYYFVRTIEDPYSIVVWAMSRDDYTSYLKSASPKITGTVKNSSGWTSYANAYPFPYANTSEHTYTVLIPVKFLDTDDDKTEMTNTVARPDSSAGYVTTTFRAYMEYDEDMKSWWLNTVTAFSLNGNEIFEEEGIQSVYKKEDTLFPEEEYAWPPYVQSVFGDDSKDYYFVRSASDPYTLILWGMEVD